MKRRFASRWVMAHEKDNRENMGHYYPAVIQSNSIYLRLLYAVLTTTSSQHDPSFQQPYGYVNLVGLNPPYLA